MKKFILLLVALLFNINAASAQYVPPGGSGSSGSGTVNSGTANQTGYYAGAGTAVSGVGPSTAGQVYTSNGAASAPSFQTISGTGTVTSASVVSANGFAGTVATATTTPAITLSTSITGVLKGAGTSISAATAGTDYQAPITLTTTGTSGAATFSGNTLNIPQYVGGVSSFTGDSTILSNSASTGAVTATLANAAAYTALGNFTSSAAAPTYGYGLNGVGTITGNNTFTNASPSVLFATSIGTETLPSASTCIGKNFLIYNAAVSGSVTVQPPAGDSLYYTSGTVSNWIVPPITSIIVTAQASGKWYVTNAPGPIWPSSTVNFTAGALLWNSIAGQGLIGVTGAGTAGQLLQSNASTVPTFTSTPGSGTILTSIAATTATTPVTIQTITTDTDGATITFNLATSNWHNVVLGGNRTLALSNATVGQQFTIQLTQPASGGPDTVTWFSGITWNGGGSAPTLQTAANAIDTITFKCTGSGAYIGYPTLQNTFTTVTAQKTISSGTSPSVVVTSGGGTGSPTAAFTGTAHDESGQITFTAGTAPSGTILTVTYGNAAYTSAPIPVVCGASANGIAGAPYVSSQSTTGFAITLSGVLTTSATYLINYIVKQ